MLQAKAKWVGYLLLATALFYWKLLFTGQFSLLTEGEGVNQAYSWLQFISKSIRHGSLPIWDPFTFSGHSFPGEMQTGGFYPVHLLLALIPFNREGVLSPHAYNLFFVFTHFLGACFFFALARELGRSRFASLVSGLCFSLAGMVGRLTWPHLLESSIWLPVILLFLLRAFKERNTRRAAVHAAVCGLALGMSILAGGLHVVIMQGLVILSAAAFYGWQGCRTADEFSRRSSMFARITLLTALAVAVGGAAGAIQLLPSAEYSPLALRWMGSHAVSASDKIPYAYLNDNVNWPHSLASALFSDAFAGKVGSGEKWSPYMGVFSLILVSIGVWKNRSNMWVRYAAGLGLVAFLYSLGSISPLNGLLYSLIPKLSLAREASRFIYLTCFAMAVLIAFGIDSLLSVAKNRASWEPLNRVLRWVVVIAAVTLVLPGVVGHVELNMWNAFSIILIFLSYALFRSLTGGNTSGFVRFLVVALILFDAAAFDWGIHNKTAADNAKNDYLEKLMSCRDVSAFLKSRPGVFRVDLPFDAPPNIGDAFDIQETGGAGATMAADYLSIRTKSDLLNDEYILKPASAVDPDPIYEDASWKIYKNATAFPRAWLVHTVIVEPRNASVFQRLNDPNIDLRQTAFIDTALAEILESSASAASEQAVVSNYKANSFSVSVATQGRALLVMSETFYPGWRATVNGKSARIYKVDGGLRGVIVPAGDSHVSFHYLPSSVLIGAALSAIAFIGTLMFWYFGRRRPSAASDRRIEYAHMEVK
jgi:hypothetical protein